MTSTEMKSVTCKVRVEITSITSGMSNCKGAVELTSKELIIRQKPLWGKEEIVSLPWEVVRDLKVSDFGPTGFFSADFGGNKGNDKFTVFFVDGDWRAVCDFLKLLPESTRQKKCQSCGGPIGNNICAGCGRNYLQTQAKHSLAAIGAGAAVIGTGIALTTSSGDQWYIGLCLLGAILCVIGVPNFVKVLR